jgi:hypothetical protein
LLRERVDAIGRDLTLEQGKTLTQAKEILATADYFTGIAAADNLFGRVPPTGSDGIRRLSRIRADRPCVCSLTLESARDDARPPRSPTAWARAAR